MGPGVTYMANEGTWYAYIPADNEFVFTPAYGGVLYLGDGVKSLANLGDGRTFLTASVMQSEIASKIASWESTNNVLARIEALEAG